MFIHSRRKLFEVEKTLSKKRERKNSQNGRKFVISKTVALSSEGSRLQISSHKPLKRNFPSSFSRIFQPYAGTSSFTYLVWPPSSEVVFTLQSGSNAKLYKRFLPQVSIREPLDCHTCFARHYLAFGLTYLARPPLYKVELFQLTI